MDTKSVAQTIDKLNTKRGWGYSLGDPTILFGTNFSNAGLDSFTIVNSEKSRSVWISIRGIPTDDFLKKVDQQLQDTFQIFEELYADDNFESNLERTLEVFQEIAEEYKW